MQNRMKKVWSMILVAAIVLSFFPGGIFSVHTQAAAGNVYEAGYTWAFDQTVTLGNTKGLVSGNAAETIKVMNHEGNGNALTPNRAIADGVLTTEVVKNWGGTVGHGVFYQLPAALEVGRIYELRLNLYGGNDAAAMNGIAVSFGDYTDVLTGDGGNIQQWTSSGMDGMHNADTKLTRAVSGNLPTAASNVYEIEFIATDAMAAAGWMLISFPLALNGSYKLGSVRMDEVTTVDGYTWEFDKTVEAFTTAAEFKMLYYGNEANTVGIVSSENYASNGSRSLKNGVLTTVITTDADWARGANGIYYKLPVGLTAGQEYVVSMNLYASAEGTALVNNKSSYIRLSFANEPTSSNIWTAAQIEGIHNAETLLTYRAPDYLSTNTANELAVTFVATDAMAENDGWMLISMPLAANKEVKLGAVTLKEKKNTDNHFLNGDFSDGLTGWMVNHDSSYISVQDSVLNVSDKVPTGDVKLYQAMYLEAGIYRLSFDVLGAPTSWRPVYFMGTALDNSSVISSQRLDQESGIVDGDWWTVTRDVTISTAGTYYFQMNLNQVSDGASVAPAMQYDNFSLRKLLKVTTDLNNASLSAETTTVALGQGYTNTLAANAGYELSEVTVTMGGVEVADAYDAETGKISIAAVTGDLHIQAEAVRKMLNITTELSNASLSTEITTIAQGEGYENTVIANAGYEVSKVTVTMDGVEVTDAYDEATGKISIPAVTGELYIQVETDTVDAGNLLTNGRFNQGSAGWTNNGIAPVATIANGVLKVSTQKTDEGDARTYATVQLAPGSYQLSFDVKGTPANYRPIVGVSENYWTYNYGQYFMFNYDLSESEWTTITETFTVPESAADANTGLASVVITVWSSNASYAPETEMQFDNFAVHKLLKVTTELSNAKLSADIKTVAPGQSYENTVTANAGYEVSNVTVTMGGAEVANVYNAETGKISVSNVTADLHIQVETVPLDASNLLTNGRFNQGSVGWANNGTAPVATVENGVLKVSTEKTTSGDARTYAIVQLAPGSYQLSFDVKGTPANYRPIVGVSKNYWTYDYGEYVMYQYGLSDSEWTTITETFTVPESAAEANTGLASVCVTIWNSNASYAPASEMQFDNFAVRKMLNVTTDLSNASLRAEITEVAPGQSYENAVTANAGYEISKVTVTMGDAEVTDAYDAATGKISIAAVTADLHIQVETAGNLLVNGNFDQGETGWGKNQHFTAGSVTDGMLVLSTTKTSGDAIFYQSMNLAPGTYQLTFDGKGTANQYRPLLYIGINQWSYVYGQHCLKDFGFGEEWKTATVQFTVPESAADAKTGLAPVYVALWTSNGSYAPETEMQLDNFVVRKLLKVTTDLSNTSLNTEITTVVQGQSYENTVTANAGYEISKVTVTMGDAEVTDAYDAETGKISIPAVTADLHIQVETAKIIGYNLLTNGNFDQGNTGWTSNAVTPAATIADGVLTLPTEKTSSGDARTYTSVQLAPGIYQLSFEVKGTPAQYRPYVGVSENYWTNNYGQYFMYQYDLSDDGWTTITETFIVPKSAADVDTGLAPVVVTVCNSNASYAPVTEMQFDNFKLCELDSVIITWKNEDGTVLEEDLILAGSVPEYNGEIPTKEASGHNSYKCIGWDQKISAVDADTTYTAKYEVTTTEHVWGEGVETKAPTCTEPGEKTYTCSVCNVFKTESILPNGEHTWDEGKVTMEPTCDADGVMTYTCSACGVSYTEAIDQLSVVAQIGDTKYATLQDAVKDATENNVVVLLKDSDKTVTVSAGTTLNLDLNGHNVTKIVVEGDGKFYGMDTTTDDYNCEDGYGKIGEIAGPYEMAHQAAAAGYGKRYVAVKEADGISFHRFYVGITHVALRPGMGGAGYAMTIAGDSKVQSILKEDKAYGYTLSVTIDDEEMTKAYSGGKADFEGGVKKIEALTIDNILVVGGDNETRAGEKITAKAFIHFEGMDEPITVPTADRSFKDIVLATEKGLVVADLTEEQKEALIYMYNELGVDELNWEIPNIAELVKP